MLDLGGLFGLDLGYLSELFIICHLDAALFFDEGFFLFHYVKDDLAVAVVTDIHELDVFDGLDAPVFKLRFDRLRKVIAKLRADLQDIFKYAA